jgi:hypothetical protein
VERPCDHYNVHVFQPRASTQTRKVSFRSRLCDNAIRTRTKTERGRLTVSDDIQQDDHQERDRYEHCHPATNHRDLPCRRIHSHIMFIPKRRRLGSTTIIIIIMVEQVEIEVKVGVDNQHPNRRTGLQIRPNANAS